MLLHPVLPPLENSVPSMCSALAELVAVRPGCPGASSDAAGCSADTVADAYRRSAAASALLLSALLDALLC